MLSAGLADAPPQRVVAEADFHLRLIVIAWLADDIRQAVLSIVAVAPAGLPVIFLNRAAVDVITPLNTVKLRHAVEARRPASEDVLRCHIVSDTC